MAQEEVPEPENSISPTRSTSHIPEPAPIYEEEAADWEAICSEPQIDPTAWVAPGAVVVGRVTLKKHSSVWYGSVLRGDSEFIEIGEESNVQDGCILHADPSYPCIIGNQVTLGHRAIVHASIVEGGAMIGIGATVLTGCRVGAGALVAAGAVVMEGTEIPAGTLWVGCPARQVKTLTDGQRDRLRHAARHYVNNSAAFQALEQFRSQPGKT